jgi:hypothetical protein
MTWFNNDKLLVKFGLEEAVAGKGGEFGHVDDTHELELVLTLASVGSAQAIVDENIILPKGAFLEKVVTIPTTAAAGSSSTLTLGLFKQSDRTTYDADGLTNAQALSTMDAAGETTSIAIGSSAVGSAIGTKLTENCYIGANYGTAAFTDGVLRVRIFYSF